MGSRTREVRAQAWLSAVLGAGIAVAALLLIGAVRARIDLSGDREYSLSPATEALLGRLEDRLQLKLYFNRDVEGAEALLPARAAIEDFLEELRAHAPGMVSLEIVDPTADALAASHAELVGIVPLPLTNQEVGSMSYLEVYQGLEMRYQDRNEVVPFLVPAELEFAVTVRLANLLRGVRPVIGFHSREPRLPPLVPGMELPVPEGRIFENFRELLGRRYGIRDLDLTTGEPIGADVAALVVARPEDLSEVEVFEIDQFLARGGHVLALVDRSDFDPRSLERRVVHTGLDDWLAAYGVGVPEQLVWDQKANAVRVGTRTVELPDGRRMPTPVVLDYGLWPLLGDGAFSREHAATGSIDQVKIYWAQPVVVTRPPAGVAAETLMRTSAQSWLLAPDTSVALSPGNVERLRALAVSSGPPGSIGVGAVLQGAFPSTFSSPPAGLESREVVSAAAPGLLIVIGDADLFRNGLVMDANSQNADLALNLIDWLAQDESLIGLRSRGKTERRLRDFYGEWIEARGGFTTSDADNQELDRAAKRHVRHRRLAYGWANVLAPALLVLFGGLFHVLRSRGAARRGRQEAAAR
ncbi:MAG TPA: Gldg family protein [Planctomycetota bacterium]